VTGRSTLLGDVRALGKQAPLRVIYEVGKRSGAHGALLRATASRARPRRLHVAEVFMRATDVPDDVAQRCLDDAKLIRAEGHRAFGRRLPVEKPDDWNQTGATATESRWPADSYWWNIDIRSDDRIGDVKWAWEIGRHRDLVILARAAALEPNGEWDDVLTDKLRSWLDATPAERGVHWYSNLEVALRAIAWIQILALRGQALPDDVLRGMGLQIDQSYRHILVDFPYTASSMRNNHLLGDSLGLIAIDQLLGSAPGRLSRLGERAFGAQLSRHMRPDGSMIEDSLSYHRFVLEMLVIKRLLGDESPDLARALRTGGQHLERLGAFGGELPQWGDWDEGRVLASSGDPCDFAGSAALALALTGTAPDADAFQRYDEIAWYAPKPVPGRHRRQPPSPSVSGGLAYVSQGDWKVWFKCGTAPSHQHADLTHVSIWHKDRWLLIDPGTATYNGPADVRNAFRTSQAHNGLQVGSQDMFVPHRAFRWLTSANAAQGAAVITSAGVIVWGAHNAYSRLPDGGRVARTVLVTEQGVSCVDWREDGANPLSRLTLALPAGTTVEASRVLVPDTDGGGSGSYETAGLPGSRVALGEADPFAGWQSRTYGDWIPAPWVVRDSDTTGPQIWSIALPGTMASLRGVVDGSGVVHAGIRVEVIFTDSGARLDVVTMADQKRLTAFVRMPS
jgi:Heparinase II/III-like protein